MSEMHDPYEDQLAAARYRAERDQARQECERLRNRLRDSVPRKAYERRRAAWLRHIRECETALHRRRELIKKLENAALDRRTVRAEDREAAEWVRDHGGLDAVEQRLMPEVMEWLAEAWPRFEDDAPVRMCDEADKNGENFDISTVTLYNGGDFSLNFRSYPKGERVRRPAPKVLDADGVEIRVGDTVWVVGDAWPSMKVLEIKPDDDPDVPEHLVWCGEMCCEPLSDTKKWRIADQLTHRAPVFAADGRPLREGETVWSVDSGTRYTVEKITDELIPIKCRSDMGSTVSLHQSQLTHERPESWERIEEDAKSLCHDIAMYLGDYSPSDFKKSGDSVQDRVIETVRRCRALAERGE